MDAVRVTRWKLKADFHGKNTHQKGQANPWKQIINEPVNQAKSRQML
ncbi:MAG: hypothetical protein ACLSHN_10730 [Eubacterium sp.]